MMNTSSSILKFEPSWLCTCSSQVGKWIKMQSLEKARSHNGCAALNGLIYTVGGTFDSLPIKECSRYGCYLSKQCETSCRYNPSSDTWETLATLEHGRYQCGVVAWKGMVIAAGGCDRWNCSNAVEVIHDYVSSSTWFSLPRLSTQ